MKKNWKHVDHKKRLCLLTNPVFKCITHKVASHSFFTNQKSYLYKLFLVEEHQKHKNQHLETIS